MTTVEFQRHVDWRYLCSNPRKRFLVDDFMFSVDGRHYGITSGFWTDSASIPRAVWSLIGSPFTGRYVIPALIHDMLYCAQWFRRDKCDEVFYAAMLKCHVPKVQAWLIYKSVRMWGWISYNGKTDAEIEGALKHLIVID